HALAERGSRRRAARRRGAAVPARRRAAGPVGRVPGPTSLARAAHRRRRGRANTSGRPGGTPDRDRPEVEQARGLLSHSPGADRLRRRGFYFETRIAVKIAVKPGFEPYPTMGADPRTP